MNTAYSKAVWTVGLMGLSAAALTPLRRRDASNETVKTVLPTPVSVPVMKKVRFIRVSKAERNLNGKRMLNLQEWSFFELKHHKTVIVIYA